jgi:gas vesicle protein
MGKNTNTLLGFLAGAAVGAAVVWLLKTEQGKEWLQKMKNVADDLRNDAEEGMEDFLETVENIATEFDKKGEDFSDPTPQPGKA